MYKGESVDDLSRVSEGFLEEILGMPVFQSCLSVVSLAFTALVFWDFCAFIFQSLCFSFYLSFSLFLRRFMCFFYAQVVGSFRFVYMALGGFSFLFAGLYLSSSSIFFSMQ
jgi:hypothetical protein